MDNFLLMLLQHEKQEILETNTYTCQFGLSLTEAEIQVLMDARKQCLKEQQRVEFGEGILKKMIYAFCDSDYIYQENYADTLVALQDIFYLYKNESMDDLTDDELIAYMRKNFDELCQGSLEYLADTCLENFARKIRVSTRGFIGRYAEDDD